MFSIVVTSGIEKHATKAAAKITDSTLQYLPSEHVAFFIIIMAIILSNVFLQYFLDRRKEKREDANEARRREDTKQVIAANNAFCHETITSMKAMCCESIASIEKACDDRMRAKDESIREIKQAHSERIAENKERLLRLQEIYYRDIASLKDLYEKQTKDLQKYFSMLQCLQRLIKQEKPP